jgi:hypothetical protein
MLDLETPHSLAQPRAMRNAEVSRPVNNGKCPKAFSDLLRSTSPIYLVGLMSANPARPVDARWQIALAIASGISHRRDFRDDLDQGVLQALRYLKAQQTCLTDADQERLPSDLAAIHAAYQLNQSPDKLTRGIVEARLLAGQSVEETAAACNLQPEIVQVYERLFFAVVAKRQFWAHMMCAAIGEKCWYGLTEADTDIILKRGGLLGGPRMVDRLVRYYSGGWSVPDTLEGLTKGQLEELHEMLFIRCGILCLVLPALKCHRALQLYLLLHELKTVISSWPPLAGVAQDNIGEQGQTLEDREVWWTAWRQAILAAIPPVDDSEQAA